MARLLWFILLTAWAFDASAEGTVETLEARPGATQRILILDPNSDPLATVLLYTGGHGRLRLGGDGSIGSGKTNFLIRSRDLFLEHGFRVLLVDMASDSRRRDRFRFSADHAADNAAVIRLVRKMGATPIWLVGTSRGSNSVANIAARLSPGDGPDGIVLTSSVSTFSNAGKPTLDDAALGEIRVPVLMVHHRDDDCHVTPFGDQQGLLDQIKKAPKKELIGVTGGSSGEFSDRCKGDSHHGFLGIEGRVVAIVAQWIKAHSR